MSKDNALTKSDKVVLGLATLAVSLYFIARVILIAYIAVASPEIVTHWPHLFRLEEGEETVVLYIHGILVLQGMSTLAFPFFALAFGGLVLYYVFRVRRHGNSPWAKPLFWMMLFTGTFIMPAIWPYVGLLTSGVLLLCWYLYIWREPQETRAIPS